MSSIGVDNLVLDTNQIRQPPITGSLGTTVRGFIGVPQKRHHTPGALAQNPFSSESDEKAEWRAYLEDMTRFDLYPKGLPPLPDLSLRARVRDPKQLPSVSQSFFLKKSERETATANLDHHLGFFDGGVLASETKTVRLRHLILINGIEQTLKKILALYPKSRFMQLLAKAESDDERGLLLQLKGFMTQNSELSAQALRPRKT